MIFVLIHSETETAGLIEEVLKESHTPYRVVNLFAGDGLPRDVADLQGLVVMGGPMNVDQVDVYPYLLPEVQLIERVIKEGKPVLGICLGSQLIAKALGSRVYPNQHREVGWHPIKMTSEAKNDELFKKFPTELDVLHWHGDTFDLPEGAVHLAASARCTNQAFRWGKNTYGLQFHLEVTPAMVQSWVGSEDGKVDVSKANENGEAILNQTPTSFATLQPHAKEFLGAYVDAAFRPLLSTR